jgi:hypothetical protein
MIGYGSGRHGLTVAAVVILWSAAVPAAARPDGGTPRYFDSERGRDLGACTADAPCRTLARYRSVARRGDPMVLVDGSVFREEIPMVGPTAISRSGTGGAKPAVSGADLVARPWTAEGRKLWYLERISNDPVVFFHDGGIGDGRTIGRRPRKLEKDELREQWDYYWDAGSKRLYVYSVGDPSTLSAELEYGVRQRYADVISVNDVSFDGVAFYGARGRDIGLLAYRTRGPALENIDVLNCTFGPSGGQHLQLNGAVGRVIGNEFFDWNVEGVEKYYAWQGIASPGIVWSKGAVIADNAFHLTIGRPTLRGFEPIDSGPITVDLDYWASEISGNRIEANGLGAGILVYRPTTATASMLIERNIVLDANTMALDLSAFGDAPTQVTVRRNWFSNSDLDDIPDTEAVRFRSIGPGARIDFQANVVDGSFAGDHPHPGVGIQDVTAPVILRQNTIYATDGGVELKGEGVAAPPVSLVNNLVLDSRRAPLVLGRFHAELRRNLFGELRVVVGRDELGRRVPERFLPLRGSPAAGVGAPSETVEDFTGRPFSDPPSIGAFEAGTE